MKIQLKHLVPSPLELIGAGFLSVVIIFLANSKSLLNYYGLGSSNQLIKTSAGNVVTDALKTVDSFSATNGVVTFLIWAVVGVICFGIVEALGSGYQQIRLEKQISSKNYVHPISFTQANFWRGVVLDTATLVAGLTVLALVLLFLALFLLPLGLAYSRVFLFDTTVSNSIYLLLGVFVVFAGLMLNEIVVRSLLYRRKVVQLS